MLANELVVSQEINVIHSLLEHLSEVFFGVCSVEQPSARSREEEHGQRFEASFPLDLRRSVKGNSVGILEGSIPEDGRPGLGLLIRVGRDDERLRDEVNGRHHV